MAWRRATLLLALTLPWASTAWVRAADPFDEGPYLKMYDFLPRAYNMSPGQIKQFRAVMERIVEQYHKYLAARSGEVDTVRQEYLEMQELRRSGVAVPLEQRRAMQRRRSAVIQASPLGVQNVMRKIEQFLPPEQVAAARGRRSNLPPTTAPGVRPAGRAATASTGQGSAARFRRSRSRLSFKPPESWPRYVESVIRRDKLHDARADEARRLLAELQQQVQQYRREHRAEYDDIVKVGDVKLRRELLDRLEAPVGDLFDVLVERLGQLADPNASQK